MTDAYDDGNLNQGETNSNVGQDESVNNEESSTNWEEQAKYFQSEKDKLQNENSNLKKYEKLAEFIQGRPDIATTIQAMASNPNVDAAQRSQRVELDEDEFDAWEAYNDPKSKSYRFRQQELQDTINNAVNHKLKGIQKQQGMQQLETQLAKKGLNDEQIASFMDFASKNPAEYGVDGAIQMWDAVVNKNNNPNAQQSPTPLDGVRQTQSAPTPGGILQGQQPVAKDESKTRWEGVMKANRVGNKIP
tara:strand:+ start:2503 stop:3243 length:741 start_codon:yes stop_codon:yes gene_type:complete